ncbi:uncharacterized protein EDB93DRAFT_1126272 [Suillus bovinus]|uniref:uncharacterized protein n=1 Tax=Suillus bovinus TaxID=48563 RepID=UPI001B85EB65|nr:uncharacterized protein EDB93DRAFT_1126272 [Suillus bovinus]KAG2156897.1 hypothetical protein EDB93DRAFT_1126272 [Suillus bovinus]
MSSSSGLYIPIHRRAASPSSSSSSRVSSPAHSLSPLPHDSPFIYTPSDLLLLASSPLSKLSHEEFNTLRAVAPEIVQSRRQRRSREWRMNHSPSWNPHGRSSRSHSNTSESEGEGHGSRM